MECITPYICSLLFGFFEKFFLISLGLVSFCDILDPTSFQMVNVCKHKI